MKRITLNCLAGMTLMLPMASMAHEPNEHEEAKELCEIALSISAEKKSATFMVLVAKLMHGAPSSGAVLLSGRALMNP